MAGARRIESIDVLRGVDIFMLTVGAALIMSGAKLWGDKETAAGMVRQLTHAHCWEVRRDCAAMHLPLCTSCCLTSCSGWSFSSCTGTARSCAYKRRLNQTGWGKI